MGVNGCAQCLVCVDSMEADTSQTCTLHGHFSSSVQLPGWLHHGSTAAGVPACSGLCLHLPRASWGPAATRL